MPRIDPAAPVPPLVASLARLIERRWRCADQRLEELEKIALTFEGIDKAYAIQAGREVRVFVEPNSVDDLKAYNLARDIAKKIENELKYPGEIKVNVIREMRVTEYAR